MLFRFSKLWIAVALLISLWCLDRIRQPEPTSWLRPAGAAPGPVKILQFYANVGTLTKGEKALLCYGVENARVVRIAPLLPAMVPSVKQCLEIVPEHTTHYTLLAEGYDGRVATRSLTLPVQAEPEPEPENRNFAAEPGLRQSPPIPLEGTPCAPPFEGGGRFDKYRKNV